MLSQLAHHPGEVHLRIAGLEAALHRGLVPLLGLGVSARLEEEIGIAAEVLDWRERDRVDPILDDGLSGGREARDPQCERTGTKPLSDPAGSARLIQPYRSASSAS